MTEENELKLQVETKKTFLTPFPKHRLSAHHLAEMWEMRKMETSNQAGVLTITFICTLFL